MNRRKVTWKDTGIGILRPLRRHWFKRPATHLAFAVGCAVGSLLTLLTLWWVGS